jgi:hypothetical protein
MPSTAETPLRTAVDGLKRGSAMPLTADFLDLAKWQPLLRAGHSLPAGG